MDKGQAVEEAGRVWRKTVGELNEVKRRIREEAEAEIERETERRRREAAKAIHRALDLGASKAAIRSVTTKAYYDFEGYVALGEELAAGSAEADYISQRHVAHGGKRSDIRRGEGE